MKYFFAEKVPSAKVKKAPVKVKTKFSAYSLSNDIFHNKPPNSINITNVKYFEIIFIVILA